MSVYVASPEDTILSKLQWAKMSGSERQTRDALRVYEMQRDGLDEAYLARWAVELGVEELLEGKKAADEPNRNA